MVRSLFFIYGIPYTELIAGDLLLFISGTATLRLWLSTCYLFSLALSCGGALEPGLHVNFLRFHRDRLSAFAK